LVWIAIVGEHFTAPLAGLIGTPQAVQIQMEVKNGPLRITENVFPMQASDYSKEGILFSLPEFFVPSFHSCTIPKQEAVADATGWNGGHGACEFVGINGLETGAFVSRIECSRNRALDFHFKCRRLAVISEFRPASENAILKRECCAFACQVSPCLGFSNVSGGFGGILGLGDGIPGGVCCAASVNERPIDKPYTDAGDNRFENGGSEHEHSPEGHILLGLEVLFSVACLGGGWLFGIRGFQFAGNALDRVLGGARNYWWQVAGWLGLALLGAGLIATVVTYWLSICARCR
jgi:hypothetical protein